MPMDRSTEDNLRQKLLKGSAKLFVTYEKCASSWKQLRKSLIKEFSKAVNSRHVHKELSQAKKRNEESYHEYVYRMMEIASHADIELEAKIQYIIEGIQDEPFNKSILYGARDIKELRARLTQYEAIQTETSGEQTRKGVMATSRFEGSGEEAVLQLRRKTAL